MGVIFEDDKTKSDNDNSFIDIDENILRRVRRATEHFADLAIKSSWEFHTYFPSIVSISCVICARMANNITPLWNSKLKELTLNDFAC